MTASPTDPAAPHPDDPESWRHATARVNGVDLHYVRVDPDPADVDAATEPPLVVLLHGFPECWYAWRGQLDPLAAAGYRVIAPDLRGYGGSSTPDGVDSYRIEELVADVRGLVAHLGYARTDLVGHDWGGLIAWEAAIEEPDLLRHLAVLNAPHPDLFRETARRSPRQLLRSWYALAFQVPWLPEQALQANDFAVLERVFRDATPAAFSEADVQRYRAALAPDGAVTAALNYYRAQFREQLGEELRGLLGRGRDGTVRVPTLVIWGERDRALGVELLDGLDSYVPDLRVERLPEATHWVQADEPERVTALLRAFLDRSERL
jgi:pimeloyl-ACP methyl ester carboxylesterase